MPASPHTFALRPSVHTALAEAKTALVQLYGDRLAQVILFGSQARGEAHDESDVDVLLVLRGDFDLYETHRQLANLALDLSLAHQLAFSFLPISESRFEDVSHPLSQHIRREGVSV